MALYRPRISLVRLISNDRDGDICTSSYQIYFKLSRNGMETWNISHWYPPNSTFIEIYAPRSFDIPTDIWVWNDSPRPNSYLTKQLRNESGNNQRFCSYMFFLTIWQHGTPTWTYCLKILIYIYIYIKENQNQLIEINENIVSSVVLV